MVLCTERRILHGSNADQSCNGFFLKRLETRLQDFKGTRALLNSTQTNTHRTDSVRFWTRALCHRLGVFPDSLLIVDDKHCFGAQPVSSGRSNTFYNYHYDQSSGRSFETKPLIAA